MTQPKVMLLIDADNVSIDVIEQTVAHLLAEYGALHGRRAYCNAECALKHQATFKRLGIRPMVNLAAGKNSTDIALAVDTMELVMRERPDVLAIASSDSDFAPLVTRVREKGCRVLGFGQDGKTGDSTVALYDRYVQFTARGRLVEEGEARPARGRSRAGGRSSAKAIAAPVAPVAPVAATAPAPTKTRSRRKAADAPPTAAPVAAPVAVPVPQPAVKKTSTRKASGKRVAAPAVDDVMAALLAEDVEAAFAAAPAPRVPAPAPAATPVGPAARPDEVQRLIGAAPELQQGQAVDLNRVAEALRKLGLLGKNASSIRWLQKHPMAFELTPPSKPNKVRLRD
ncbi:NYN domain-containing protein [Inhella crocodyli]|nr:NYN domain-containing protein [Inhella crocodyli]